MIKVIKSYFNIKNDKKKVVKRIRLSAQESH